jgi:hypothetical protein
MSRTPEPEYRCVQVRKIANPLTHVRQPFLTPVPPLGSNTVAKIAFPLLYALGVIRTTVIVAIATLYLVLVSGLCTVLVRRLPPN